MYHTATANDVESQRKGVVDVADVACWKDVDEYSMKIPKAGHRIDVSRMFAAIPARIAAIHHCYPDRPFFRALSCIMVFNVLSRNTQRLRLKFHFVSSDNRGHQSELYTRYQLKGYGLPMELLPLTETGNIKTAQFLQWTKTRKYVEEQEEKDPHRKQWVTITRQEAYYTNDNNSKSTDDNNSRKRKQLVVQTKSPLFVECPGSHDIVFRHGKTMTQHPGNIMFRDLILTYFEKEKEWTASRQQFVAMKILGKNNDDDDDKHDKDDKDDTVSYGKHHFTNYWIFECQKN